MPQFNISLLRRVTYTASITVEAKSQAEAADIWDDFETAGDNSQISEKAIDWVVYSTEIEPDDITEDSESSGLTRADINPALSDIIGE